LQFIFGKSHFGKLIFAEYFIFDRIAARLRQQVGLISA